MAGDTIEVEYPEDGGITMLKRGIVSYVQAYAGSRYFITQEGATLARYTPGASSGNVKFTIINRAPMPETMLAGLEI